MGGGVGKKATVHQKPTKGERRSLSHEQAHAMITRSTNRKRLSLGQQSVPSRVEPTHSGSPHRAGRRTTSTQREAIPMRACEPVKRKIRRSTSSRQIAQRTRGIRVRTRSRGVESTGRRRHRMMRRTMSRSNRGGILFLRYNIQSKRRRSSRAVCGGRGGLKEIVGVVSLARIIGKKRLVRS